MSKARVTVVALDAADPELAQRLAAAGEMPALAGVMREGAAVRTMAPMGVFVSANWPTLFTATMPDRHRYICWEEFRGGTYDYRETTPELVRGTPFWERLSDAGKRVGIFDVPHTIARPVNGAMVAEWGCHDRHFGTNSWPHELADELAAAHGHHLGTCDPPGRDQFAPCDYNFRDGEQRTDDETVALFDALCEGIEMKRGAVTDLLDRGGWDFFMNVMGEAHCVGHQMWHLHDPEHPRHDAELAARVGGDPVVNIYRRLDAMVADQLARRGPGDTAYVLFAHGMAAHHDGTHVLDHVLHRLDWGLDEPGGFGAATRAAAEVARWIPRPVRGRALRAAAPMVRRRADDSPPAPLPPLPTRRWFLSPNNTVVGGVRLNLAGREPAGRVHPADRHQVLRWLARRLEELVNLDTGGRVVRRCVVADDVYRRAPDDTFADLYVEWERSAPIERVWSPAIGTVAVPYGHWRQGDHTREGVMFAVGPGIEPGARRGVYDIVHVGATFAAAAGHELDDVDGHAIASVLPAGTSARVPAAPRARRPNLSRALERRAARRTPGWALREPPRKAPVAAPQPDGVAELRERITRLERQADVATMGAWLPHAEVAEDALVSVVMPTRDRAELLRAAVASVEAQSYSRWELLIVDDASTDGTGELLRALDDPRIRVLPGAGNGACAARNIALEVARGDVITYLDDDNTLDPHWLKAVALTFAAHADATVAYGARVCDDYGRVHGTGTSARPWLQFPEWDAAAMRDWNLADTGMIAHRPGDVRFDESLAYFGDWDLLLRLTEHSAPVEIPAIAVYYTTHAPDRLSTSIEREELDRESRRVLEKLGAE